MNAAVNDGEDDQPFDLAIQGMVQQYGALRVMLGALRQMRGGGRRVALPLSAHLRRDIGLRYDDAP